MYSLTENHWAIVGKLRMPGWKEWGIWCSLLNESEPYGVRLTYTMLILQLAKFSHCIDHVILEAHMSGFLLGVKNV
jgi:hypothetical protein